MPSLTFFFAIPDKTITMEAIFENGTNRDKRQKKINQLTIASCH